MDFLFQLPENVFDVVEYICLWVGFSTLVGLIASLIVIGKRGTPGIGTVAVGYAGTIIGWGIAKVYTSLGENLAEGWREQLLTPATFLIGVGGAISLLIIFRLVSPSGKINVGATRDMD